MLAAVCRSCGFAPDRALEVMQSIEEYTDGGLLESACRIAIAKRIERLAHPGVSLSSYRLYGGDHEVDIVVNDQRDGVLHLYEVKRKETADPDFARHISDEAFVAFIMAEYGAKTVRRAVLYRGEDTISRRHGDCIPYLNIGRFLMRVENGEVF